MKLYHVNRLRNHFRFDNLFLGLWNPLMTSDQKDRIGTGSRYYFWIERSDLDPFQKDRIFDRKKTQKGSLDPDPFLRTKGKK